MKKNLKKVLAVSLTATMAMTACSSSQKAPETTAAPETEAAAEAAETEAAEPEVYNGHLTPIEAVWSD